MFFQAADGRQAVNCVSGKSADALCNDEVYLSRQGISNHCLKALSALCRASGDALIRVHLDELPVLTTVDVVGIIADLCSIGRELFLVVRRYTGVCRNLPFYRSINWC